MKQIKLLLGLCLAFLFSSMNNTHAQVSTKESTMSLGSKTAFILDITGANKKMVERQWKAYMKEYGKVESNKKAKEMYTMGANISGVNAGSNVYMKTEDGKDMTRVLIFVDNGEKFVTEDDADAGGVEKFAQSFGTRVDKEVAKKAMEAGEKELKGYNKDLSKLEKKNKKLHEAIEKYKKKIEEAEADIQQNLIDQDGAKETIEKQKEKVEELTNTYNSIGKG